MPRLVPAASLDLSSAFISSVFAALDMVDCRSLMSSSGAYELVELCESATSLALSKASSHSSAAAEVAEPSEDDAFGSSNETCRSRYYAISRNQAVGFCSYRINAPVAQAFGILKLFPTAALLE